VRGQWRGRRIHGAFHQTLHEHNQYLEGSLLQLDLLTIASHLSAPNIDFKISGAKAREWPRWCWHSSGSVASFCFVTLPLIEAVSQVLFTRNSPPIHSLCIVARCRLRECSKQISAAGRGLCGGSANGGHRPNWQGIIPAANQGDRHARM
jgi:hypothetical protein